MGFLALPLGIGEERKKTIGFVGDLSLSLNGALFSISSCAALFLKNVTTDKVMVNKMREVSDQCGC